MRSKYLTGLSENQKDELRKKLWNIQNKKCFICENEIDLQLHRDNIDIDHIQPLKTGGKDNETNFGLAHAGCNRSKQASDLRVARALARFEKLKEKCAEDNRMPNLNDILKSNNGTKFNLKLLVQDNSVKYSLPELNNNTIYTVPLYKDGLSGLQYFFAKIPIEYLFHDDRINPRSIGGSLSGLVQEFFSKRPQLHVSLGWINLDENNQGKISVFDGQHKATAQVLLGIKELPVRIFVNADLDLLLTANTNAGTKLKQVAFDKSVQRHLGSNLYFDRVKLYQKAHGLDPDNYSFSEKDLVNHFKGESKGVKRYILDAQRDSISHDPENKLKDFMDFGGRRQEKPLSYSSMEKTVYSFFIYQNLLETSINYMLDEGQNPRELERQQIIKLLNIIAEEIYIDKFDTSIGTSKIENRIQNKENIPEDHMRAFRMSKEEILHAWIKLIHQIIKNYFLYMGKPIDESRLFQYKFPPEIWNNVKIFIHNLKNLPLWINKELSLSVFGGKQTFAYWQKIFETGETPSGQPVLSKPINFQEMMRE